MTPGTRSFATNMTHSSSDCPLTLIRLTPRTQRLGGGSVGAANGVPVSDVESGQVSPGGRGWPSLHKSRGCSRPRDTPARPRSLRLTPASRAEYFFRDRRALGHRAKGQFLSPGLLQSRPAGTPCALQITPKHRLARPGWCRAAGLFPSKIASKSRTSVSGVGASNPSVHATLRPLLNDRRVRQRRLV